MNYADYGIDELDSDGIEKGITALQNGPFNKTLEYLSDKLGWDHNDPKMFEQGLATAESWGLINHNHTNADTFFCQSLHASCIQEETECVLKMQNER